MAVHIGNEMKARFEASGMTVRAFAARIGRSPKNIYEIFERPSIDTQILRKASEALHYNFFRLYAEDIDRDMGTDVVAEPAAEYKRRTGATVIVIQGDTTDAALIERITKAAKP